VADVVVLNAVRSCRAARPRGAPRPGVRGRRCAPCCLADVRMHERESVTTAYATRAESPQICRVRARGVIDDAASSFFGPGRRVIALRGECQRVVH